MAPHSTSRTSPPHRLAYGGAVLFCLLAPLFVFVAANRFPLASGPVALLCLSALIAGGVTTLAVTLGLMRTARVVLWLAVVFALLLVSGVGSLRVGLVIALLCGAVIAALKHNAASVAAVAAAAHVLLSIILHPGGEPASAPAPVHANVSALDLPPVVHLVLDGFSGLHGLPSDIAGGAALRERLRADYARLGFDQYSHAYSPYFYTANSLPNMFNFAASDRQEYFVTQTEASSLAYRVDRNRYFEILTKRGYALRVYQSGYIDYCTTPGTDIAHCETYPSNSIRSIANVRIGVGQKALFIANSLLDSSPFLRNLRGAYYAAGERFGIRLPTWSNANSRTGPLAVLPVLAHLNAALRTLAPGDAYVAHLLMPHSPLNVDAGCNVRPNVGDWLNERPFRSHSHSGPQNTDAERVARYQLYFAQVECLHSMMNELFASIRASGQWQRAIIIVHGDHGSRIVRRNLLLENLPLLEDVDFRDAYSAFYARKDATSTGRVDATPRSLAALLAGSWQVPMPAQGAPRVYLRVDGSNTLHATPLAGFAAPDEARQ